jgi:hypothetical protein
MSYSQKDIVQRLNVPRQLTSVVFLMRVCEWSIQTSVNEFGSFWYGIFAKNLTYCSLGNIQFNAINNIIIDVYVPCKFSSIYDQRIVDATMMNSLNQDYYITEWTAYIVRNTKLQLSSYRHKLFIIPKHTPANFYGLGYQGCDKSGCFSWYNTEHYTSNLFMHELGHNFGLDHSRRLMDEYGDETCVMGNQPNRCWNAAHRYALNWSNPISTFDMTKIDLNTVTNITLEANHFIQIENKLFAEHVNVIGQTRIPSTLHIYWLNVNYSTDHLCSLLQTGMGCNVTHVVSPNIHFVVSSITRNLMNITFCQGPCLDLQYNTVMVTTNNTVNATNTTNTDIVPPRTTTNKSIKKISFHVFIVAMSCSVMTILS